MGENTAISWCDHTHNPWWGCSRKSPGCEHCYAEAWAKRCGLDVFGPASTTPRRELSDANWKKPLKWDREAFEKFGRRARVFTGSMCDLFEDHPQLPPLRARQWDLIEATPNLEWLLLTKRIENVMGMVPERWIRNGFPEHVRIGCTVENQAMADERIPELLTIPARNFLSMEPLLELVDLWPYLVDCLACDSEGATAGGHVTPQEYHTCGRPTADWIIVGGESGPHARPFDVGWARDLIGQCQAAGVPVFMKQLGSNPRVTKPAPCEKWPDSEIEYSVELKSKHGSDPSEWPEDLRVQEYSTTEPER